VRAVKAELGGERKAKRDFEKNFEVNGLARVPVQRGCKVAPSKIFMGRVVFTRRKAHAAFCFQ
jgi:hypothetical protein